MKINVFELPVVTLPLVNMTTDPLDVVLTGIGLRLLHLAKTNEKFRASLQKKDFVFQIGTQAGLARHFTVTAGRIASVQGAAAKPDFALIFTDSETAVKTLMKGDPTAFMTGMQTGTIKMEGDFALLMWFNSIAKLIPPTIPKPVMLRVKQALGMVNATRVKFNI